MRIKSYYARAVEDAMGLARHELGPDAMLVNSRKAPPEARHLGEYEVVFGVESATASAGAESQSSETAPPNRLVREVADLRKQLEGMRRTITRSSLQPNQWLGPSPGTSDAYAALTASDVSPELARELVQTAESRATGMTPAGVPRVDPAAFERALLEEMRSRINVQPSLGRANSHPAIAALVGPPGAGKTATLVKLAVNYGLTSRRPVMLLSADTYRVAAAEQLRSYAAILGVGFQVVQTVGALAQHIEENRGKDLILIDTPGLSFPEMDYGAEMAQFLSTRSDIDTHLVLPASMKSADLTRVIESYEVFKAQRLLFTRLDETGSYGPIFNEAVRTGKPVSFLTNGQRIPEDLEAASPERLVQLILSGQYGQALAAA